MLIEKIKSFSPRYHSEYDELVKSLAQFGGGRESDKFERAKFFSNAYEIYMYAFFIGLKFNKQYEILPEDKAKKFWEIKNWKPEELVNYMLLLALTKSQLDFNELEQLREEELSLRLTKVKQIIESYANGGFSIMKKIVNEDPQALDDPMFFLDILEATG